MEIAITSHTGKCRKFRVYEVKNNRVHKLYGNAGFASQFNREQTSFLTS